MNFQCVLKLLLPGDLVDCRLNAGRDFDLRGVVVTPDDWTAGAGEDWNPRRFDAVPVRVLRTCEVDASLVPLFLGLDPRDVRPVPRRVGRVLP